MPEIPNAPSIYDRAKTEDQRQFMRFVFSSTEFGRPYVLPPEVQNERVELMRRAMADTVQDPDLVAEASKLRLDMKRFQATWDGAPVDLTLTEFWLAHSLARYPGHVKDRDQLMRDAHIVVEECDYVASHDVQRDIALLCQPAFSSDMNDRYGRVWPLAYDSRS